MDTNKLQQLDVLVTTIDDLLDDSTVAAWHSALLQEAKNSFSSIQQKATVAAKESLIGQMMQQLSDVEREIQMSLEVPLKSLRRLAEMDEILPDKKVPLLLQVGKTHDILGEWNQALDVFYKSLDFSTAHSPERAEILKYLGHIKSKQQDYPSATKLYFDSIAIYTMLENKREIGNLYLSQGYNNFEQGLYKEAEDYYQLALKLATNAEDNLVIADCNNILGVMSTVRGAFDDAIGYYTQAIEAYENLQDLRGLSTTYQNLAMLQVDMEEWQDAGESYQQALEYAQQVGNLELVGLIHLNRAELSMKLYDYAMAQACCRHALKVFGRLGGQTRIAEAYKFLGFIYGRQEKWEDAQRFFARSIDINDSVNNLLGVGEARYESGLTYSSNGDKDNAKEQLTQALEIFEQLDAASDLQKAKVALEKLEEDKKEVKAGKIRRIRRISK